MAMTLLQQAASEFNAAAVPRQLRPAAVVQLPHLNTRQQAAHRTAVMASAQHHPAAAPDMLTFANLPAGRGDPSDTLQALDVPPCIRLGPRVEHITVPHDATASEIISDCLGLPAAFTAELIRFGAVHYSHVHPLPPARLGTACSQAQQRLDRARTARAAGAARHGTDPRLSVVRRLTSDIQVHENGYMRVHVHPKRFPAAYAFDMKERIVAESDTFVVVNKPPGIETTPTVCNHLESCLMLAARAIGRDDPLLITHRLDTCTEGVLVLGKTPDFVPRFNALLRVAGSVRKFYRVLSLARLQTGDYVNYVTIRQRQQGESAHTVVHKSKEPGSLRCELEVLDVQQVALTGSAAARWGADAFEHLVEIKTGRTHQIRVQFAAAGAPLLGDSMYNDAEEGVIDVPIAGGGEGRRQGKRLVVDPIGLQACKILFQDDIDLMGPPPASFEAGAPWWRR